MRLDLAKVALQQIVEGVVSVTQGVAAKRRIAIVQEVSRELPALILDGPKVKQILYNLLSNAVKFSNDGDRVTVAARWVEAEDSELQVASVEIAVVDQGIGIAPQDHARIFEEFQQASSSSTRRYPGTGLGLALVKRYAELLGGKVSVESEEDEGSTFRVLLPADATPFVTAIEREASGILMRPSWARLKPRS